MNGFAQRAVASGPYNSDQDLMEYPWGHCHIVLQPEHRRAVGGDWIIPGMVRGKTAVDAVFTGRRRALAAPLIARLEQLKARAQENADAHGVPLPRNITLPVTAFGAWRPRFSRDLDGWQTKRFQLIVAVWRMRDSQGRPVTRGTAPARFQPQIHLH